MATVLLSRNGTSVGIAGNPAGAGGGKRGTVGGWSSGAVRRHTRWLWRVDTAQLEARPGWAITLTMRDCPPNSDEWKTIRDRLLQACRDLPGVDLVSWLVEWQRRGVPHLHLAVYGPLPDVSQGEAEPPITCIMSTREWTGLSRGSVVGAG